jgi:hypothetical protein
LCGALRCVATDGWQPPGTPQFALPYPTTALYIAALSVVFAASLSSRCTRLAVIVFGMALSLTDGTRLFNEYGNVCYTRWARLCRAITIYCAILPVDMTLYCQRYETEYCAVLYRLVSLLQYDVLWFEKKKKRPALLTNIVR